jgi:hypothetical protein
METEFSSVDVLTMALSAAQMLRSSGDTERALANAYAALGQPDPHVSGALPLRIVQLILDAGQDRGRLYTYLRGIRGPLSWCRPDPPREPEAAVAPPDEEARRYRQMSDANKLGVGHSMFWRGDAYPYFPSFRLLERSAVLWFHGPTVVIRRGEVLSAREAAPPQTGDDWKPECLELPARVCGLIDYPFEVPTLFEIETGLAPWDVWDICCAFADRYMKLYEQPGVYGIWGHDLSELWIEDLIYYPDHQLIYPDVGS